MKKYSIRHDKNERGGKFLSDGKLALGITIGTLAAIFVHLILDAYFAPIEPTRYIEISPVIVSLLVAVASTYLAANALIEQRKARQASTDPVLIAHLGQREDARELITFNVSNIGAGAALNVLLNVDEPEDDLEKRRLLTNVFKRHHPFSVIPHGKSIEFSLHLGWELLGDNPLPPFQAKLSYEDLAGEQYESEFTIDVREMEGLSAEKSPQMRMVAALEKIAKK